MSFNPGKSKEAHEIIFSAKTLQVNNPAAIFNNVPVVYSSCQNHLG